MGCTYYQILRAAKILRSDGIPIYPDLSQYNQKRASLCQKGWIFGDSPWRVIWRTIKITHFVIGRLPIRWREYQIYSSRTNHVWGMNGFSRSQSHPAFSPLSNIQRSLFLVWRTKLSISSLSILEKLWQTWYLLNKRKSDKYENLNAKCVNYDIQDANFNPKKFGKTSLFL